MHLNLSVDVRNAVAGLNAAAQKQVPFAIARALTALAFEVQRAEQQQIIATFRNPRPFTRRSVVVDKATKSSPTATVSVRPEVAQYLAPFEFGGPHYIPGRGIGIAYPKNVRLDSYGQVRSSPAGLLAQPNTFAGTITFQKSGQTISGIWQRPLYGTRRAGGRGTKGNTQGMIGGVRTGLKLLERFGDALEVHKHLGFQDRAKATVALRFPTVFNAALTQALKG